MTGMKLCAAKSLKTKGHYEVCCRKGEQIDRSDQWEIMVQENEMNKVYPIL